MKVEKIISGGQTGADQGGLEAGKALGIPTGGTAPQHFMTERGKCLKLRDVYGLVEGEYDPKTYPKRTALNVMNSDATAVFGNVGSAGTALTCNLCTKHNKPCLIMDTECLKDALRPKTVLETFQNELHSQMISESRAERWGTSNGLVQFIEHNNVKVLNIAGNRESKNPGLQARVRNFLLEALR